MLLVPLLVAAASCLLSPAAGGAALAVAMYVLQSRRRHGGGGAVAAARRRQRVAAAPLDVAFVIAQEIALSVLGLLAPLSHPSPIAQHSPAQYSEADHYIKNPVYKVGLIQEMFSSWSS